MAFILSLDLGSKRSANRLVSSQGIAQRTPFDSRPSVRRGLGLLEFRALLHHFHLLDYGGKLESSHRRLTSSLRSLPDPPS